MRRRLSILALGMVMAEMQVYPYENIDTSYVRPCRRTAHVNTSRLTRLTKKQRKNRAKSIRAKAARKKQRK